MILIDFLIVVFRGCSFLQVNSENNKPLDFKLFYEQEGSNSNRYDSTGFWERRYHRKKASLVYEVLDSLILKDYFVLDAGCGSGELSMYAKKIGANVVSLDISKSYLRRVRKSVDHLICASSNALPFRPAFFDIVISADVIEHIPAYDKVLGELNYVYKKLIIITTPCDGLFRKIYSMIFSQKLYDIDSAVGHIHIFSISKLKQKLQPFVSGSLTCRSYHVLQPYADNFLSTRFSGFISMLEKIADILLPYHGTISLVLLSRK